VWKENCFRLSPNLHNCGERAKLLLVGESCDRGAATGGEALETEDKERPILSLY
jgi:hypothetical protein